MHVHVASSFLPSSEYFQIEFLENLILMKNCFSVFPFLKQSKIVFDIYFSNITSPSRRTPPLRVASKPNNHSPTRQIGEEVRNFKHSAREKLLGNSKTGFELTSDYYEVPKMKCMISTARIMHPIKW